MSVAGELLFFQRTSDDDRIKEEESSHKYIFNGVSSFKFTAQSDYQSFLHKFSIESLLRTRRSIQQWEPTSVPGIIHLTLTSSSSSFPQFIDPCIMFYEDDYIFGT